MVRPLVAAVIAEQVQVKTKIEPGTSLAFLNLSLNLPNGRSAGKGSSKERAKFIQDKTGNFVPAPEPNPFH